MKKMTVKHPEALFRNITRDPLGTFGCHMPLAGGYFLGNMAEKFPVYNDPMKRAGHNPSFVVRWDSTMRPTLSLPRTWSSGNVWPCSSRVGRFISGHNIVIGFSAESCTPVEPSFVSVPLPRVSPYASRHLDIRTEEGVSSDLIGP